MPIAWRSSASVAGLPSTWPRSNVFDTRPVVAVLDAPEALECVRRLAVAEAPARVQRDRRARQQPQLRRLGGARARDDIGPVRQGGGAASRTARAPRGTAEVIRPDLAAQLARYVIFFMDA